MSVRNELRVSLVFTRKPNGINLTADLTDRTEGKFARYGRAGVVENKTDVSSTTAHPHAGRFPKGKTLGLCGGEARN